MPDRTPDPGDPIEDPTAEPTDAASGEPAVRPTDEPAPATAPATAPARRPSPAAAAASRARRIGGRVGPGAASSSEADTVDGAGPVRIGQPVKLRTAGRTTDDRSSTGSEPGVVAVVPTWLRWLPAGVLTAGAIAMAVLMLVFSHGVWWGRTPPDTVREQMLAAAKTCVAETNTYKYNALDKYDTAVSECTTGRLTPQIRKTITTVIKKYAPTLKATQTASISRGAIEAVSPHGKQWTVLVFGQLSVVNTNEPKGRTDPFAAQVQMEKVHGKWLMSGLKTVATPVS
jgi:hypothetical protein